MGKVRDREMVEGRPSRFVGLDENGIEHPDPTPVAVPTRLRMPGNQVQRMRALIRRELSDTASRNSFESFDEADDFEMEEVEWVSPYELQFEPEGSMVAVRRNGAAKEREGGERLEVDGSGKTSAGVGVGPGDKGAGKAGGEASGVAGGSGSVGKSGEGDEGGKVED